LLGCVLRHESAEGVTSGIIVETEGYLGHGDSASHARFGRTPRSATMFGIPGIAYVYFVYGMHYMFNVVTEKDQVAGAVLVRALEPVRGTELMAKRRGRETDICCGPARLCQAFAITREHNGADLTRGSLSIRRWKSYEDNEVEITPRIGVGAAGEPYRYLVKGNLHVSK